jgi:hypothetical protein
MSGKAKASKHITKRSAIHLTFSRFVEAGRLVVISYGPLAEKVAIIADIIDQNRVSIATWNLVWEGRDLLFYKGHH